MEALPAISVPSLHISSSTPPAPRGTRKAVFFSLPLNPTPTPKRSTLKCSVSTEVSSSPWAAVDEGSTQKLDWYAQWYPVMPLCDLDKRKPHGKRVLGIDVVVWWDRNEPAWRVFDDTCPHRLAPLSEGRIDQRGRLQCVYHGWCFHASGDCTLIPQAPPDGPPIHTFKRACAVAYPTTVQHDILWFWPNSDPQYKDILSTKKPPYIPELDDPSFSALMGNRDIPYGHDSDTSFHYSLSSDAFHIAFYSVLCQ